MRVLITGGSGLLGRALIARLRGKGDECFILSRRPEIFRGQKQFSGATWLSCGDPLPEVDAVVNLAGESVAAFWTEKKKLGILQSRVEGTKALIRKLSAQRNPPRIIVSASAVGWYGDRPGELLTENSGPDPEKKFRWQVCAAWEKATEQAGGWGARVVHLRIGNVLDREGGYLWALLVPWRCGLGIGLGAPEAKLSWVGLSDAARLMEFSLENEGFRGPVNVTAPHPISQAELMEVMKSCLRPWLALRIPAWLLRVVLGKFSQAVTDSQEILPEKALGAGFKFEQGRISELFPQVSNTRKGGNS